MRNQPLKVFIHLPKCAGTTIDFRLSKFYGKKFFQYVNRDMHQEILEKHYRNGFTEIDFMSIHNPFFKYDKYFSRIEILLYTVTRDPIDAFISLYNHQTDNSLHPRFYDRVKNLSIRDFLSFSMTEEAKKNISPNFQCRYLCGSPESFRKSKRFIEEKEITYCGIQDFEKLWNCMVENIDFSSDQKLLKTKKNVSNKKISRKDLESSFIEEISSIFREDRLLYEYTKKGNLSEKLQLIIDRKLD